MLRRRHEVLRAPSEIGGEHAIAGFELPATLAAAEGTAWIRALS